MRHSMEDPANEPAVSQNRVTFNYKNKHLDPNVQAALSKFDLTGDNTSNDRGAVLSVWPDTRSRISGHVSNVRSSRPRPTSQARKRS